jgi:lipopolysaccharide transport system ATP-binding protein
MSIAIRAENLSKLYRIGGFENYVTLRERITRAATAPARLLAGRSSKNGDAEHIWALKDVSFDVREGEVVGIIGRNGAGKSTLLKILSRVTKPTHGHAEVRGRLGTLLEVGTGFHPELTGRENTFLNGAILGMSKREVARKFDEIVAFAEIEKFIDTPVKHYSSGMYLRLAFSVAAHLETEILVVDEVLAVGDATFQKKCIGKMGKVSSEGRTVIFVSHNMGAVQQLTNRCVLLNEGRFVTSGAPSAVIAEYQRLAMERSTTALDVSDAPRPYPDLSRRAEFISLDFADCPTRLLEADDDVAVRVTVRGKLAVKNFVFGMTVYKQDGTPVGSSWDVSSHSVDRGEICDYDLRLRRPNLAPGLYYLALGISTPPGPRPPEDLDVLVEVLHFEVLPAEQSNAPAKWAPSWGSVRFQGLTATPLMPADHGADESDAYVRAVAGAQ